jgi:heme exporter protein C
MIRRINWYRYASPVSFYPLAGRLLPWFMAAAAVLTVLGLYVGFFVAPTDYQQGEVYRIIFLHVPAAWMSMFVFVVMALYAVATLAMRARLPAMMIEALAPTGMLFTFIALWSGSLWGRPTWGTYWVWDARLTSELLLLFLYFGYFALRAALGRDGRSDRACAVLVLVGAFDVPVIYYSVTWWNTLHQGASVSLTAAPRMAQLMLLGMLLMALAVWMYTIAVTLARVRCIIREREPAVSEREAIA